MPWQSVTEKMKSAEDKTENCYLMMSSSSMNNKFRFEGLGEESLIGIESLEREEINRNSYENRVVLDLKHRVVLDLKHNILEPTKKGRSQIEIFFFEQLTKSMFFSQPE